MGKPPLFEEDGDSPYEDEDYISSESEDEKTDGDDRGDNKDDPENTEQIQNGLTQEYDNQVLSQEFVCVLMETFSFLNSCIPL